MESINLVDFGAFGLAFGVFFKLLDYLIDLIKAKWDSSKEPRGITEGDSKAAKLAAQAFEQTKQNGREIMQMQKEILRLLKVVADGNGQPPITKRLTIVETRLEDHIKDQGLHTTPR